MPCRPSGPPQSPRVASQRASRRRGLTASDHIRLHLAADLTHGRGRWGGTPFSGGSGVAGVLRFCCVFLTLSCRELPIPPEPQLKIRAIFSLPERWLFLFPSLLLTDSFLWLHVCAHVCRLYTLTGDTGTRVGMRPCTPACGHVPKHAHTDKCRVSACVGMEHSVSAMAYTCM